MSIQRVWLVGVSGMIILFAYAALVTQFCDFNPGQYNSAPVSQWAVQQQQLTRTTNILEMEELSSGTCRDGRTLDLALPKEAKVYMTDMIGPTNGGKAGIYFYFTYYLFPRKLGVCLDGPAQWSKDGFHGLEARNNEEISTNGYDVVIDTSGKGRMTLTNLGKLN